MQHEPLVLAPDEALGGVEDRVVVERHDAEARGLGTDRLHDAVVEPQVPHVDLGEDEVGVVAQVADVGQRVPERIVAQRLGQ